MANCTKFFRNGKSFSAFCRMRYGQSKKIWDDPSLWEKTGKYAIGLDINAADAKFPPKEDQPDSNGYSEDDTDYERRQEEKGAYIASGAGLQAYYEDRDAGYAY